MTIRKADMDKDFDKALNIWARSDLADDAAVERLVTHAGQLAASPIGENDDSPDAGRQQKSARKPWPWAAGGAIAASLVAALVVLGPQMHPDAPTPTASDRAQLATLSPDEEERAIDSFALLYTLTDEEEEYI